MSSISQPTAGDPLTWTRPSDRHAADTRPPRVVIDLVTERTGTGRVDAARARPVRAGVPVLAGPESGVVAGVAVVVAAGGAGAVTEGSGDGDAPESSVGCPAGSIPAASATPSENGPPTSPAAPKPTPTAAIAKAAHSVTSATRLSMAAMMAGAGLTLP